MVCCHDSAIMFYNTVNNKRGYVDSYMHDKFKDKSNVYIFK